MNSFLKENWFKLSIVAVLLLLVSTLIIVNIKQAVPMPITTVPKVNNGPQIKIEKCKISSDILAKQQLQLATPTIANAEVQKIVEQAKIVCEAGSLACANGLMSELNKNTDNAKNVYYQAQYQQAYSACLSN
ncbi:MAG: hypothetical protein V4524_03390 [Patescibacteria group bacterium]